MTKKILTGVLAAVMAVSLTACSDSKESGGDSTPANNSTKSNTNSVISEIMSALEGDGTTSTPVESTPAEPSAPVIADDPNIVYSPAEDFEYWYDEAAGGTMIRGYIGAGGEVAIPKEIDGKPVTSIDINVFKGNTTITSIYIPSTIKEINTSTFESCTALETVTLKNGLETIEKRAFYGCEKLKSIEIPDTVTNLEGPTRVSSSTTPDGIFCNCTSLETVVIGKGVASIPAFCFYGCKSLKGIIIPGNAKIIGNYAFAYCENLETAVLEEGVTEIGKVQDALHDRPRVFAYCKSLANLTLPKSLHRIGACSFEECSSLTDVVVPDNCILYGGSVFLDCENIKAKFRGKTYTYDNIAELYNTK